MARRAIGPNDMFRVIGGMRLMKRPSEVDVATNGKWILVRVSDWGEHPWYSYKLFCDKRTKKRVYHLNWNADEKRFAKNRELAILAEYHGEMVEWVQAQIVESLLEGEEDAAAAIGVVRT